MQWNKFNGIFVRKQFVWIDILLFVSNQQWSNWTSTSIVRIQLDFGRVLIECDCSVASFTHAYILDYFISKHAHTCTASFQPRKSYEKYLESGWIQISFILWKYRKLNSLKTWNQKQIVWKQRKKNECHRIGSALIHESLVSSVSG